MPSGFLLPVAAALAAGLAVALLTGPVRAALIRKGVYDAPNARSSHDVVKPRGGGLAILAVLLPGWLAAGWATGGPLAALPLAGLTAGLAALSFVDDVRGLSPAVRFPAQLAAVALGLWALGPAPVFQGWLPGWLDVTLAGLAWLWFVNLYNFMDGIDGITGVETLALGLGLGLVGLLDAERMLVAGDLLPWLLAGAAAGFLAWNWAPSRIFLGDVGSVPLGFLLGALLLDAAAAGQWAPALILPAYYLVDATFTLLRRLARGEKVWHAHREHAYQRAVQAGLSHAAVAGRIAAANAVLIGCALAAVHGWRLPALVAAAAVAVGLWVQLNRAGARPSRP
jgi:UDP-N-acetylmuramyl pentapeptide phosphotransferase/UDP-N-acetylglucosamine-1-phosphate transferase